MCNSSIYKLDVNHKKLFDIQCVIFLWRNVLKKINKNTGILLNDITF